MFKIVRLFCFFLVFFAFFATERTTYSYPIPKYSHYINDYAHIIKPAHQQKLQRFMQSLRSKTGVEMAILTMRTIDREPIEDFALETFNTWQVGKRGKDNGVLFVLVIDDETARIEVGYGLEGILTDGICGEILDKMILFFEKEQYSQGVYKGLTLMINEIALKYEVTIDAFPTLTPLERQQQKKGMGIVRFIRLIFFLLFFLMALSGRLGLFGFFMLGNMAGRGYWSGGDRGGFGGFGDFGGFGGGSSGGGGASRSW